MFFLRHDVFEVSAVLSQGDIEVVSFIVISWAVEEEMSNSLFGWYGTWAGNAGLALVHVHTV